MIFEPKWARVFSQQKLGFNLLNPIFLTLITFIPHWCHMIFVCRKNLSIFKAKNIFLPFRYILYTFWQLNFRAELGTRQFCRDNVIMFSGHKVVCNCHFTILVVATPSRHRGLTIFRICSGPWLVLEALWHCRVVVVAKLKNCRVPSSGFTYTV